MRPVPPKRFRRLRMFLGDLGGALLACVLLVAIVGSALVLADSVYGDWRCVFARCVVMKGLER